MSYRPSWFSLLLWGLLIAVSPTLRSQSALAELEEIIGSYRDGRDFARSAERLPALMDSFEREADWINLARARHYLGEVRYELDDADGAYEDFRGAEQLIRQRGVDSTQLSFYHLILQGQAVYHSHRSEEGQALYRRLITFVEQHRTEDRAAIADGLVAQSTLAYAEGSYAQAGELLRAALEVGEDIYTKWQKSLLYNNLATMYGQLYELERAQAVQRLSTVSAVTPAYRMESMLNECSGLIELRELNEAGRLLTKARRIIEEQLPAGCDAWLQYFSIRSHYYNTADDLVRFRELLKEWDGFLQRYPRHRNGSTLGRYWNYRASLAIRSREYVAALAALRKVDEVHERYGVSGDLMLSRHLLRAKIAGATGDFELASQLFYQLMDSWSLAGPRGGTDYDAHLPAATLWVDLDLLRLVKDRAAMYSSRDLVEGDKKYRAYAYREISVGDSLIQLLRRQSDAPGFRRLLDEVALDLRKIEIGLAERNYRENPDRKFLETALRASEEVKYLDLSEELINAQLAQYHAGIGELLRRQEANRRELDARIGLLRDQMLDTRTLSDIRIELERLGTERDGIREELNELRTAVQAGRQPDSLTVGLIRSRILGPDEALLHLVEQDTIVYLIYVDHEREAFLRVKSRESITDRMERLLDRIDGTHPGIYEDLRQFHQLLIDPVAQLIEGKSLVIVPDGTLTYLPFAALIGGEPTGNGYPYLLRTHRIRLLLNCRSTLLQPSIVRPRPELEALALAPFSEQGTANWRALRGSERTVNMLCTRLGSGAALGYTSSSATHACFKREAGRANLLHIGTHTQLDNERPSRTALLFAPIDDPEQGGYLRAREIGTMDLGADLAVLAACQTMGGRLFRGRGVANLAEAFTRAGCFNLLVNLWEIKDETAHLILADFYESLYEERLSKPEALRQAQLRYLDESMDLTEHPAYWATLVYVGDGQPLEKMPAGTRWLGWLAALAAASLLAVLGYRLSKSKRSAA